MEETLEQLLARLKAEIEDAEHGDLDREELARLAGELEDRLGADDDDDDGIVGRLREAVLRFEGSHPDLATLIGRTADALSGMGI